MVDLCSDGGTRRPPRRMCFMVLLKLIDWQAMLLGQRAIIRRPSRLGSTIRLMDRVIELAFQPLVGSIDFLVFPFPLISATEGFAFRRRERRSRFVFTFL